GAGRYPTRESREPASPSLQSLHLSADYICTEWQVLALRQQCALPGAAEDIAQKLPQLRINRRTGGPIEERRDDPGQRITLGNQIGASRAVIRAALAARQRERLHSRVCVAHVGNRDTEAVPRQRI